MADGVGYTPGIGTVIATDDVGGVQYQRIKMSWGPDGSASDTSATTPLPVGFGTSARYFANIYETVAASTTAQVLGAGSGAVGDYIAGVLVIPLTTSPGAVSLVDNATTINIFVGGSASVSNLVPFYVPLGIVSQSGAWKLTTGANVKCIGIGGFT